MFWMADKSVSSEFGPVSSVWVDTVKVAILHNVQVVDGGCHDSAVMPSASWFTEIFIYTCDPIDSIQVNILDEVEVVIVGTHTRSVAVTIEVSLGLTIVRIHAVKN